VASMGLMQHVASGPFGLWLRRHCNNEYFNSTHVNKIWTNTWNETIPTI